jgi:predicted ATPase/tetratricopeptide (TPR) repeat protein
MTTVPRPRTRFFGRAGDLDELERACAAGASLVTLWGPPGIGKTRLALELCRRLPRAWFCDLSAARGADESHACVLRALGVERSGNVDTRCVGVALAAQGPGVLVLDNFEHLASCATAAISEWMDAAPRITFVMTSRARLRLEGELAHEVAPLAEGRELFLDRVGASAAPMDSDEVAALVTRLENIPLAIELAAARIDVLGIGGLMARIAQPLEVLGPCGTLERTIDSSVRMLTSEQRRVFAQCAVFRGSFSVQDAEAVVSEPTASVLDALQDLRERSLLRCHSEGESVRFTFFASIRAVAAKALRASGDEIAVRRRHARHCVGLRSCDLANLADALECAVEDASAHPSLVRDAIAALARAEPSELSDDVVERLGLALTFLNDDECVLRARAHRARARALLLHGRVADARTALEQALDGARDDVALVAELWGDVGLLEHQHGDIDRARECYERALAASVDKIARARLVGNLGAVDHDTRRLDAALRRYEEVIAVFRATGERRLEATFLANMAVLLQEMGASPRARATYYMALERLELSGDRRMEAITRTNLGLLCHELGELEEARACHERALALLQQVTDARSQGLCLGRLAMVLAALGHHDDAASRCDRAESILRRIEDWGALEVLELFRAYVDWARSRDVVLARERLSHASALSDRSDDARTATRLIEASLARDREAVEVLVVGPQASWFEAPGARRRDLCNRHVLRRLLWRLVENHRAAPGQGLTLDELRNAGWPDAPPTPATALNRVHVALTELRRRGLRACLQRSGARYLIDPAVRIELRDGATR